MTMVEAIDAIVSTGWSDATALAVGRTLGALAIVIATLSGRRFARRGIRGALTRARVNAEARLVVDRVVQVGILIAVASWVADLYGLQLGTLGTLLGISGVALGLAVQDVLKQLVAGMYLMVERPFTLGDRVAIPAGSGTIRRIELLATVVDLADGGVVVVPNAWFLANAVIARGPDAPVTLRVVVTLRDTNPDVAAAETLIAAVSGCASTCVAIGHSPSLTIRVRGWTADGPIVMITAAVQDRDQAVDSLAWALRERFGHDVLAIHEA